MDNDGHRPLGCLIPVFKGIHKCVPWKWTWVSRCGTQYIKRKQNLSFKEIYKKSVTTSIWGMKTQQKGKDRHNFKNEQLTMMFNFSEH